MSHSTLVLGLGDARRGDDGFGPRTVAELLRTHNLDQQIITVDAPTVGMRLLPLLASVRHVLLVTAVHVSAPPGTLHRLEWHGRPEDLGPRLPAIRRGGIELLRTLHFWVESVPDLVVLGLEADRHAGAELGVYAALAVRPAVDQCVAELRRWGHAVPSRKAIPDRVAV